jgi:hypothetical protein
MCLCSNTAQEMSGRGLSGETVQALLARRGLLASGLADPQLTLPGVLRRQRRRCGRAGCRCARGELHGPYLYLVLGDAGRGRAMYVPAPLADAVGERVAATAGNRAAVAEIAAINVELLARRALG